MGVDPTDKGGQVQLFWNRKGASVRRKLSQVSRGEWMLPHESIHGRGQDHRPTRIPGPPDGRQAIVRQAVRQLGQRVRVQRSNEQYLGPAAQLDMQNRIVALITPSRELPGPLVL